MRFKDLEEGMVYKEQGGNDRIIVVGEKTSKTMDHIVYSFYNVEADVHIMYNVPIEEVNSEETFYKSLVPIAKNKLKYFRKKIILTVLDSDKRGELRITDKAR